MQPAQCDLRFAGAISLAPANSSPLELPGAQSVIDVYWSVSRIIAVVETEEFLADMKGVLSEDEHDALILYVAQHPEAGALIPETGGLRKLRWASKGKGKRGGSRVILKMSRPIWRRGSARPSPRNPAR